MTEEEFLRYALAQAESRRSHYLLERTSIVEELETINTTIETVEELITAYKEKLGE